MPVYRLTESIDRVCNFEKQYSALRFLNLHFFYPEMCMLGPTPAVLV